jgi:hypothetical protein
VKVVRSDVLVETAFRVGKRLRCRFVIPRLEPGAFVEIVCTWRPYLPDGLTGHEWNDYRRGCVAAFKEALAQLEGDLTIDAFVPKPGKPVWRLLFAITGPSAKNARVEEIRKFFAERGQ